MAWYEFPIIFVGEVNYLLVIKSGNKIPWMADHPVQSSTVRLRHINIRHSRKPQLALLLNPLSVRAPTGVGTAVWTQRSELRCCVDRWYVKWGKPPCAVSTRLDWYFDPAGAKAAYAVLPPYLCLPRPRTLIEEQVKRTAQRWKMHRLKHLLFEYRLRPLW